MFTRIDDYKPSTRIRIYARSDNSKKHGRTMTHEGVFVAGNNVRFPAVVARNSRKVQKPVTPPLTQPVAKRAYIKVSSTRTVLSPIIRYYSEN